jgi:hypothetical protein
LDWYWWDWYVDHGINFGLDVLAYYLLRALMFKSTRPGAFKYTYPHHNGDKKSQFSFVPIPLMSATDALLP